MVATVELVDVSIAFGSTTIVSNLGFSVDQGTLHCVAGRSGSGKTSVLTRRVAGLLQSQPTLIPSQVTQLIKSRATPSMLLYTSTDAATMVLLQ